MEDKLKDISIYEKLSYFYCSNVMEERIDTKVDTDAIRRWEKLVISRRRCKERISTLLEQIENVSTADTSILDKKYKAKRELLLLAEGTIGQVISTSKSSNSRMEIAQMNNELLMEAGALQIFTEQFLTSLIRFQRLNYQQIDILDLQNVVNDLQHDLVLLYLLILFNSNRKSTFHTDIAHKKQKKMLPTTITNFTRQLFILGTSTPNKALERIMECIVIGHVLPGFPTKRLLLLYYEWFGVVLGSFEMLSLMKEARVNRFRKVHNIEVENDSVSNKLRCKSFGSFQETTAFDEHDPYVHQKRKHTKDRKELHSKYRHWLHYELKAFKARGQDIHVFGNDKPELDNLGDIDEEWEVRCEQIYRLILPHLLEFTKFLNSMILISCGSAKQADEKRIFYSLITHGDQNDAISREENASGFWRWILREKSIILDVASLLILLMFKHFRASHMLKGEYFLHFFRDTSTFVCLSKFMNKDLTAYLHQNEVNLNEIDLHHDSFQYLLVRQEELDRKNQRTICLRNIESERWIEASVMETRTLTSLLRLFQKLSKRKPNVIRNSLVRTPSIVWLKRIVSLQIPLPRLYALKLVKSQAKYLGNQWLRKYTCIPLLTDIYLYVRPEFNDTWLQYESESNLSDGNSDNITLPSNALPSTDAGNGNSMENAERLLFSEMQAYHQNYYFSDNISGDAMNNASEVDKANFFCVDGGELDRLFNSLQLPSAFYANSTGYEQWLDKEEIKSDPSTSVPLPVQFT